MTGPVRQVRVERLLLKGTDLDAHDLARLPGLIAAALEGDVRPTGAGSPDVDVHSLAAEIAHRAVAALEQGGRR